MRAVRIGKLDKRIEIGDVEEVRQENGRYEEEFVSYHKCWARVHPLSGSEKFAAQQIESELTHRVEIRYFPGIRPQQVIKYGSRTFEIEAVIDLDEQHREMHLDCVEVGDG
ncbi:phage head closure protein [Salicibibacter cibarius]|uniref:Phage head closure protein n=1 Tax=Salicibibacter cibarius TaxID=2743000 RepID=A0A7T6Z186_9BACI|nr:phage head closure protein [Salicibibacter cibarius]QQK75091.1 phage head closure protein [Salicibibacter cibarius]